MKKKVLALGVAAALTGMAGTASAALNVLENGIGHSLIIPYFTTQGGNATLIDLVNTDTTNGKAVKVRFRSGVDSDDIFDFQVFLSPGDVWTANISQNASGLSQLTTTDKSCTLPASVNAAFITARLASYTDPAGVVHSTAEQTREGYVEIFNMADIGPFLASGVGTAVTATVNPLFTATKHVAGVAPCTSATLLGIEAAAGGLQVPTVPAVGAVGAANYAVGQQVFMPTGTLMGNWTIINVPATLVFSGGMPAIFAGTTLAPTQTNIVYSGQTSTAVTATHAAAANANSFPTLSQTEDGVLLNGSVPNGNAPANGVATAKYDFPDMSSPYEAATASASAQALALSTAILRTAVVNEYLTDASIVAGTDWVLSMPTRRYHVAGRAADYGVAGDSKGYPAAESINGIAGGPTPPFSTAGVTYAANGRSACVATGAAPVTYDREEGTSGPSGAVISPGTPTLYSLCGEVNVLAWNASGATSPTLKASLILANSAANSTVAGWARASLSAGGLPVLGDAFIKAQNGTVFFGGTYKHRYQ